MNKAITRATALLCVVLSSGCYTYAQTELKGLPSASYVHLFLTRAGLDAIPKEAVPTRTNYISGRVQKETADSVLITVPVSLSIQGNGARDLAQNVYIPITEVVGVERRQLNAGRTVLAVVGGFGLVTGTVLGISSAGKHNDANDTSANPN